MDVQADILERLNTRIVVPLMAVRTAPAPARQLNPVFSIQSGQHVMVTQFLFTVPCLVLKTPVASLEQHDAEIIGALDMVLTGV